MSSKIVGTPDQIAIYLISKGRKFSTSTSKDDAIPVDVSRLDAAGQSLARKALDLWSQATGLRFIESSLRSGERGITFDDEYAGGWAERTWYSSDGITISNSINVSKYFAPHKHLALYVYIHEIGHALGLWHPGNYNGSARYGTDNYFVNDSYQLTAMSYFDQQENTEVDASWAYPATPMTADILAIEKLYGDSNNVRTGDTVYGFNSNAGGYLDQIAGIMKGITPSAETPTLTFTLIDDGGIDIFDYSDAMRGSRVDLRPGAVSDIFGARGVMVIYKDTVIEQFLGGSGADHVTGNDAANTLVGNGGDDTLDGGAGDDILDGGAGDDTLTGGAGDDTFRYRLTGFGADTITDFTDGTDLIDLRDTGLSLADLTITASGQDRVITVSSGNTITLTGQAGITLDAADFLFGGAPTPTVSISNLEVREGETARLLVTLSAPSTQTVTANWHTADGTALAGTDYTGVTTTMLTFQPGETHQVIAVATAADQLDEAPRKTFTVAISNPVNAVLGSATGTVTVLDADPLPRLSADTIRVNEGELAQVTIRLDRVSIHDVQATWKTYHLHGNTKGDFEEQSGAPITIPAGQQSITVSVQTYDDNVYDGDRSIGIAFSDPVNAAVAMRSPYFAPVVILEDDPPPPTVSIGDVTVTEGDAAVFTISLDKVWGEDVTMVWQTLVNSAQPGTDYTSQPPQTITVPAGQQSITISVQTLDDDVHTRDRSFFVVLDNFKNALAGDVVGRAIILEDDPVPPTLSIDDVSVDEGGGARFTISLNKTWHNKVWVNWTTVDGSATAGSDYIARTDQRLIFLPGVTSKTIAVRTLDDEAVEGAETFGITLSNPDGATLATSQATATVRDNDTAPPTAGAPVVSIGNASAPEGEALRFEVRLSHAAGESVSVMWGLTSATAKAGIDYTGGSGRLTFAPGELSQVLTIATVEDTVVERHEYLTAFLYNPEGVTLGGQVAVSAEGLIINDDNLPTVSIDDVTVAAGADAAPVVRLSHAASDFVQLLWTASDGQWGEVKIAAGQTAQALQLLTANTPLTVTLSDAVGAVLGDAVGKITIAVDIPELIADVRGYAAETGNGDAHVLRWQRVLKALGETDAAFANLTPMTATEAQQLADTYSAARWSPVVTALTEIEALQQQPVVSIDDVTVTEGGNAQFTVSLDKAWTSDVTVDYTTADGSASAGSDYTGVSTAQTLTIAAGQQSATLTVATTDDSIDEPDETFTVTLANPSGATLGDATGTATITDNDNPPALSIGDVTVTEGGTAQFTISLDAVSGKDVTVSWATSDGTATAGSDYTARSSQSASIAAGQSSATITVQTTDDSTDETDETFTVTLSNPVNATLGDATGEATVTDNDDPPPPVNPNAGLIADIRGYAAETNEGTEHVTRWQRTLKALGETDTAFANLTPMTATEAQTYLDKGWTRWERVVTALTELEGQQQPGTNTTPPPPSPPVVAIDDVTVTEGGNAQFTVSLDKVWSSDVTVDYTTADGSASAGSDYTGVSTAQTLTITAGQQSATLTVATTDDSIDEPDEAFTVTLANPSGATLGDATGTATITDNDNPPVLSIGDVTVTEGGTAQFTISLDAVSGKAVTVSWATSDGTASAGSDYTARAGQSASIAAGQSSATITVQTTDDSTDETDETFTVTLSNPVNATLGDATGEATVTDNDDRPPPANPNAGLIADIRGYAAETNEGTEHVTRWQRTLKALGETDTAFANLTPMTATEAQTYLDKGWTRWERVVTALTEIEALQQPPVLSIDDVTVTEGANAQFSVSLDKVWSSDVTVDYTTADGSASAGSDYTGVSTAQTLTIAAGQQSATLTVSTTDDSIDEPNETFTVTLANPSGATLGDATGTATITDNDDPPSLSINDVTVTEGGAAQFTISLDAVSGKAVTVNWATSDGTATAGSDYTARAGQSATIAAGQQSATITVSTTDDSTDEPNETFTITLTNPVNATLGDAGGEAIITDNDDPPPPPPPPPPPDTNTPPDPVPRTLPVINGLTLTGTAATDILTGNADNDRLDGHGGGDRLDGRGGDDILNGGPGSDTLHGGAGDDVLTGGAGFDFFYIDSDGGQDVVTDFDLWQDWLVFRGVAFRSKADMRANYVTEQGDDLVIYTDADRDHSVTLEDFVANGWQAADLGVIVV